MGQFCGVCLGNAETIYQAANEGHDLVVRKILMGGFDPNQTNPGGLTAMHNAALFGHQAVALTLLEYHADVDIRNSDGYAAIHYASHFCHLGVVQTLLDAGAKTNSKDSMGHTCLFIAILPPSDETRQEHLQLDVVRALVKARCDVNTKNSDGTPLLLKSCEFSPPEVVKELLNSRADPNSRCKTNGSPAIFYATKSKTPETVLKMLIDHGAEINDTNDLGYGIITNCIMREESNITGVLRILLKLGADINQQTPEGYTPLHCAVMDKQSECYHMLLDAGADETIKTSDGLLPKDLI